jgi:hypothetical protein
MALTRPRAYQIYDIDYKQAVRVVTITNIVLAGSAPNTVDGVSLTANDRILVTGQSTGSENGIYYVTTLGTGSNGTWVRSVDTNSTGELLSGTIVMVTEGSVYKDTQWKLITDDPITIGSSDLTFVQNYSANSISAGTSNVTVTSNGAVTISSAGTSNVLTVNAGSISIAGNIYPTANVTYDLGNTTNRFKDIWLSNSTIYLGNVALSANATSLLIDGNSVVTEDSGAISVTGNVTGGNLTTAGNVTGNYFVGAGSETYVQGNTLIRLSVSGQEFDFTSDTFNVNYANITSSGNITGNYIIGDGSLLTGLPASYANSNVSAYLASGDDTANIITTGNVSGTYLLGNVAFATGIPATYGNTDVADYLASGTDTANIITTGNVSGQYFLGNANVQYTASATQPTGNLIGAQWYDTSNDVLYEWQTDGTSSYWIDITGPVIGSNGAVAGSEVINGTSNVSVSLNGNISFSVASTSGIGVVSSLGLDVAGRVITTGNIIGGNILTGGSISATGNITSGNISTTGAVYSNFNTNTANTGSFVATGGNTKGGTGYLDFLVARNTSGGATNPYKWLRLNTSGGLEIINSAYTATLLTLTDAGALSVASTISGTGFNVNNKQAVNGPAFSAYASSGTTIPTDTLTKVNFQTEEYDTNGNFASSRFTPTVEGYYQLNSTVRISGASGTGEMMIVLYKNGAEYHRGWNSQGVQIGSGWWSMSVSSTAYANGSGDYFEIYVQQGSAANRDTTSGTTITWFNGCMLRGA